MRWSCPLLLAAILLLGLPGAARPAEETGGEQILVMLRIPPQHFQSGGGYDGGYHVGRSQLKRQASRIARDHHLTLVTDWPMPVLHLNCFVMRLPGGMSALAAAQEVSREPRVEWAQPMHDYETLAAAPTHNDALYPVQPAKALWQLDRLHRLATGRGVSIAVIDSGIDARHPDLEGQLRTNLNLVGGKPFAAERHGTAVAGIIAAKADNRVGITGIAPGGRLIGLRACWQTGDTSAAASCDSLSLAKALHQAIDRRATIINLSLGGPPDRLLGALLDAAMARGASVVAAYDPRQPNGGFPASHAGVIAVTGARLSAAQRRIYAAPASGIPATQPGGRWTLVDGASYAAAQVSGLVALARETRPRKAGTPALVMSGGMIDALATVEGRTTGCDGACPAPLAAASRN
jgi:hypothetical protein